MTHNKDDKAKKSDGFYANIFRFAMNKTTVEEVAMHVYDAIVNANYVLTEHMELGSLLIAPSRKDAYVVPPEVMLFLIEHDAIHLNPLCGGNTEGKITLQ
jgi:hypothetical protein